jgi:4-amino-4-deoxy-L-arabinose transferase-like glycosyltransferase
MQQGPNKTTVDKRTSQWDFWKYTLTLLLPIGIVVALYVMARQGDVISTIILGVGLALVLLFLGGLAVMFILHKRNEWEQARFLANAEENLRIMEKSQRLANAQMLGMGRTNRAIQSQLRSVDLLLGESEPEGPTLDISSIAIDADFDEVADQWSSAPECGREQNRQ